MVVELSSVEEHYLKRELLRIELSKEFEKLNDINALRKFGYPFADEDPKGKKKKNRSRKGSMSSRSSARDRESQDKDEQVVRHEFVGEFPVLSHFLQNFVMTFPLLSKELVEDASFWQGKVQVFFEHFMSLPFSSSFDREELTKRRKMALKLSKVILLFYNSGIGVSKEHEYYEQEKYHITTDGEKATKLNKFTMPSKDNLQYLLTNEPIFFNGIDINVIAVVEHQALFPDETKPKPPKSVANKWMKSNLGFDFSKLSIMDAGSSKRHQSYFIIRVRKEDPETTVYVYKSYEDFKKLAKDLKTGYPGKKLPQLPHKNKIQASIKKEGTDVAETLESLAKQARDESNTDVIEYDEFDEDQTSVQNSEQSSAGTAKNQTLPRERMRTSLRQYLRTICQEKEVATGTPLKLFLFSKSGRIDDIESNVTIKKDMRNRELVDLTNLEHQIKFQKLAFQRSLKLQDSLKEMKTSLLKDQDFLLGLFREFKEKRDPHELSPILRDFFDWCKIYMSATVYQMFLGDDSGYELYKQVRRLHKLLPYTIMIQILRFTNPIAIMKGMMDLFMAQPFGGQSLLQTMFSTILTDDLKSQDKVIEELETVIYDNHEYGKEICKFFKKAIFENEDGSLLNMDDVHNDVRLMGMPISVVITMRGTEFEHVSSDALAELMESYTYWKNEQQNSTELVHIKSNDSLSASVGVFFTRTKEYLQLLIQERDKRLMKKLWEDPQLSQLIKSMVTLFYEPMIRIFKVARVDVAFRNFEKFMNDLISLLDNVIDGNKGSVTVTNIVDEINELINKHETSFYEFAHDIYVNDTQGIFEGFISWTCSILNFLQHSKFGKVEDAINLNTLLQNSDVDATIVKEQLQQVIDKRLESRKLYSELVKSKGEKDNGKHKKESENVNSLLDKQWKQLNHMVIPNESSDFNLNDADLVDLDLDIQDYEYLQNDETDELEQRYRATLDKEVLVSELEKFLEHDFRPRLHEFLNV
ncbi:unnamed protein product [Kluyveromyces dobzhanskii CBS 2104]|uniref:WGS project CCBQ000000000 data, contig 00041 n=1 Tax=Kluyveromyces dobzhanskii CBS 2104 TaxID=1427455 RepID=A0A0A8L040_9SACH|nr:unnamed protein product [Kluyveromyces dobzhanskii CBS 2104]